MKALMISSDPYTTGAEQSIKAFNEAGFNVDLARSLIDAIELAKVKKYALVIVEKSAKENNSQDELGQVLGIIKNKNPYAQGFAHGWQSVGLLFNVARHYSYKDHPKWVEYIRTVYIELSMCSGNLS